MNQPYSVREFLDAPLRPLQRTEDLDALCARFVDVPLEAVLSDIRRVLAAGVEVEEFRRLHVLISHLYHRCGADVPLTVTLRAEVGHALLARRGTTTRT